MATGTVEQLNKHQADIVVRIRALDPKRDQRQLQRLNAELLKSVEPILWRQVNRFRESAAQCGIEEADLFQEAALAALGNPVKSFDSKGSSFGGIVERNVSAALERLLRRQGADVHLPDRFFDGHSSEEPPEIQVTSRDGISEAQGKTDDRVDFGAKTAGAGRDHSSGIDFDTKHEPSPEQLFSDAEQADALRAALKKLLPIEAEILRRVYGVGRNPISLRALAIEKRWSRTRLTTIHDGALAKLRALLVEAT